MKCSIAGPTCLPFTLGTEGKAANPRYLYF